MELVANFSPIALVTMAAVVLLGFTVRGITGFGSGLVAIPLLVLLGLPLIVVVPVITVLEYLSSLHHGAEGRAHIRWRDILPLLPFSVLGMVLALYLFRSTDLSLLVQALGLFIIGYAMYTLFKRPLHEGRSRLWAVPGGTLGGFIGTLFGTGGPFYVIYLHLRGLHKAEFRAAFAVTFLVDGLFRLGGYAVAGYFHLDTLLLTAAAIPLMALGLYIGGHIHVRASPRLFERAIAVLLLVSGALLLAK